MNARRRMLRRGPYAVLVLIFAMLALLLSACGPRPLLEDVSVEPATITPNADGDNDLATLEFTLNRNADVGVSFVDAAGRRYVFRQPRRVNVSEEPYRVLFGGVVDGFRTAGDEAVAPDATIVKRSLPDGAYTWEITAATYEGESAVVTGTLEIDNAETALPGIRGFSVSPTSFSPNQDGIADRVTINLTLDKDVSELHVYLIGDDGIVRHIAEDERLTPLNEQGWHTFDYDGGIDAGNQPPPDGTYTLYAEAIDAVGQHVLVTDTLDITAAGIPRAYILNGEVEWSASTLALSDTLCFTTTIENDSDTYLRTTGPWPGTEYRSDENFVAYGRAEESGVFRVAMGYDTMLRDYPYRWAIGRPEEELVEIDGRWYLPPRARAEITGCVQIVDMPVRNPLYFWLGLIHEDVGIEAVNNRVDPNFVTVWPTDGAPEASESGSTGD